MALLMQCDRCSRTERHATANSWTQVLRTDAKDTTRERDVEVTLCQKCAKELTMFLQRLPEQAKDRP